MNTNESTPTKNNARLHYLLFFLLLGGTAWFSGSKYMAAQQSLQERIASYERSAMKVAQIKTWGVSREESSLESRSDKTLNHAVEALAVKSEIAQNQIASIEPQQAVRENDTDFLKHSTVVKFDGVTLHQLAQLSVLLRSSKDNLGEIQITRIRLDLPFRAGQDTNVDQQREFWNVEVTLTYFMYSPNVRTS